MLGVANTRLYCCSGDILDAVKRGDALIGYNVPGSYARVAVIPRNAPQPQLAAEFIDYLLSDRGQRIIAVTVGAFSCRARLFAQ